MPKFNKSKMVVFGNQSAGKTQLVQQILGIESTFNPATPSTIGMDFSTQNYPDLELTIQIWDLSGNERYDRITRPYYKNATEAALYCVDLSKPIINEEIERDIEAFREFNKDVPLILVGTKSDECSVPEEKLASINVDGFAERIVTSAKSGEGYLS